MVYYITYILFSVADHQEVENNVGCVAQLFARRQHKLSIKKDTIAQLACAIVENPEQKVISLGSLNFDAITRLLLNNKNS